MSSSLFLLIAVPVAGVAITRVLEGEEDAVSSSSLFLLIAVHVADVTTIKLSSSSSVALMDGGGGGGCGGCGGNSSNS